MQQTSRTRRPNRIATAVVDGCAVEARWILRALRRVTYELGTRVARIRE